MWSGLSNLMILPIYIRLTNIPKHPIPFHSFVLLPDIPFPPDRLSLNPVDLIQKLPFKEVSPSKVGKVTKYLYFHLSTYPPTQFYFSFQYFLFLSVISIYLFAHLSHLLEYDLHEWKALNFFLLKYGRFTVFY